MLVVNLYGGPGTGKSTTAAGLFHLLKMDGVEVELVTEFAKDKVWEGSYRLFDNQCYVFAKQHQRLFRLQGKVDVVVTDAPLLLSLFYGSGEVAEFRALVRVLYSGMNNLDIFLNRVKKYSPNGRMQTEEEAGKIDVALAEILRDEDVVHVDADEQACRKIKYLVEDKLVR